MSIGAEHAVLVSVVLPVGQELAVKDGIVIVTPQRAVAVAHLLRRQVVTAYSLRLSNEDRDMKRSALYAFVTSDRCADLLGRITTASKDMTDLERREFDQHGLVWKRSRQLISVIQEAQGDLVTTIDTIISGNPESGPASGPGEAQP
jgi:hypothetical protein